MLLDKHTEGLTVLGMSPHQTHFLVATPFISYCAKSQAASVSRVWYFNFNIFGFILLYLTDLLSKIEDGRFKIKTVQIT